VLINKKATNSLLHSVVKLWGTQGNGVPLPFLAGERRSLAHTMTATYNTSNRKNVR